MAIMNSNGNELALVTKNTTSYESLLESQKELISRQINELQNIVINQCKLTGINPLSQEMAAGALSIKIGKRPKDLMNPKAIKYMHSIFSVKDEISKKETRAISALFGLTATQVKDFFNGQRTKVRRFIRLSREKAIQSAEGVQGQDGPLSSNADAPTQPVPLNSMDPISTEAPSCSMQDEVLPDTDDSEKHFIANIFNLLRKEETFSGQVKLMEWILQMKNASVLYWFLTNGGVMILASWLSQAAIEEQTSVLHIILRVLCHLPLHKALPAHMSAILQSVNKLRYYRGSDISNRAKTLLSRWSKMFARSQAMRKSSANISEADAQNEMLLKQSIGEIMEEESLESRMDNPGAMYSLQENSENSSWSQSIKLLTGPSDDSNIKLLKGSAHRERRKVQLVEQPGQKPANRGTQVTRVVSSTQGRPLSADDIQKAKMRAQFMRSKYGESYVSPQMKTELLGASSISQVSKANVHSKVEEHATSNSSMSPLVTKPHVQLKVEEKATSGSSMTPLIEKAILQPKVEEHKTLVHPPPGVEVQEVPVLGKEIINSEEPVWKRCKRLQISWVKPPEMKIESEWNVCYGENSKEVDFQNNRIKREKEVFYDTILEIPPNPKEPWDREMDYDDSLTPEIPLEQQPDDEDHMETEPTEVAPDNTSNYAVGPSTSTVAENSNKNMPEPDLELLAALLKNPEIVFALTAGQGGNLSSEQMVKLLDAVKENAATGGSVGSLVNGLVERRPEERVEVSLPSPTPSSNPVTSGWRQDSANNQFSRHTVTVNGDPYAIPGVYFQETVTQQAVAPITHQRYTHMVPERNINSLPFQGVTSNLTQQSFSPATHQRFSDVVPDQRNMSLQGVNSTSNTYFGHGGSQLQPQWHVVPEARLSQVQSYTGRESLATNQYSLPQYNSTHYNPYNTRESAQPAPSLINPSYVGNGGYREQPGFESWSPENSPVRTQEYVDGYNYSDPHRGNYNYRQEVSRMQRNTSRYQDRGGRNDSSRWRDKRK